MILQLHLSSAIPFYSMFTNKDFLVFQRVGTFFLRHSVYVLLFAHTCCLSHYLLQRNYGCYMSKKNKCYLYLCLLFHCTLHVDIDRIALTQGYNCFPDPLPEFLNSLPCDLIALTSGLAYFFPMTRTLAAASSFSSGRAYPSLSCLPPLTLRLIPTLIMQGSTSH